jgi:peptidoglycan hydrolase-like protein with peptidoglycan-binding domain
MNRTLRFSSRGDDVRKLQQGLNQLASSLPKLSVDGIYGVKTVGRVKEFQRTNNLVSDGIVGQHTWAMLLNFLPLLLNPPVQPVKINPFRGIDSYAPATTKIGKSGKELHTWVREKYPSTGFWGRYISRPGISNQLTREECALLHEKGFSIVIIYNGTNDGKPKLTGIPDGEKHAGYAIAAMNKLLSAKKGEVSSPHPMIAKVFIYANIEKNVDADWILGWWSRLSRSRYGAGIYYSIDISIPYCRALERAARLQPNPGTSTAIFRIQRLGLPSCHASVHRQIIQHNQVIVTRNVASIDHCTAIAGGFTTMWHSINIPTFDRV